MKTINLKDSDTEWVLFHIVNNSFGTALEAAMNASKASGISEAEFYKIRNDLIDTLINL